MEQTLFHTNATILTTVRGTLLLGWGKKTEFASPPQNDLPAFYRNDFFLKNVRPWIQYENFIELENLPLPEKSDNISLKWKLPKQEDFTSAVSEIVQKIRAGVFKKAVPYTFGEATLLIDAHYRKYMLEHACSYARDFHGYAYAHWSGTEGMIGASPEQIFTIRNNSLDTVACAGTSATQHPSDFDKILHEHMVVVEGLKKALNDFDSIKTWAPYWKQAGNQMFHLTTPIEAQSSKIPFFDELISRLHPTASIGCYPKKEGASWLEEYDCKIPRKYYGAPIGYRWPAKNEEAAYVTIRGVEWEIDKLRVLAGCGVVQSSDPLSEWYEWNAKFNAVRSSIGL